MKSYKHPPAAAKALLRWYAGMAEMEDLEGDLDELYVLKIEQTGSFSASVFYWKQVLGLVFSYAVRKRRSNASYSPYYVKNSSAMFKNYIKIAVRNFSKHKLFTSLNIIGLALGMSICLLALSISVAIYRSDDQHTKKYRIYQVNTSITTISGDKNYASTFLAMGDHLLDNYPFIEKVLKIHSGFSPVFKQKGSEIAFDGYFVDNNFFQLFDFELTSGNPLTVLEKPNSIVITEKVANKLFRDQEPLGKQLETENGVFTVTGVMENPRQTHLFFEVLTSYITLEKLQTTTDFRTDWSRYRDNYIYVLLKDGISQGQLDDALMQTEEVAELFNKESEISLSSVRLDKVVPRWNVSNALGIGWDQPSILFFLSIGILILLPAIFNYTNLTIARALQRVKEVGIRKVVGAEKSQIKAQFIVETILITCIAVVLSIAIFLPLKAEFLSMVRAAEVLDTSMGFTQVSAFVVFTLLVGFLTGIFPAQFFSRLSPIHTLKGEIKNGRSSVSGFKRGLFVFQFFLSVFFTIGVFTIGRQYSKAISSSEKFNADNILAIPIDKVDRQIALNELRKHPDVISATTSSHLPGIEARNRVLVIPNGRDTMEVKEIFIGEEYLAQMNIPVDWGEERAMQQSNQNEELVVVNRKFFEAQSVFNVKSDSMRFQLVDGTNCRIVAVIKDINYEPLSTQIYPAVFRNSLESSSHALLTIQSENIPKTINDLSVIWEDIDHEVAFEAIFLDNEIEKSYYFLKVQMKFFSFLSALAIIISILGLLGMVSFSTENRTKEIAIRKIMGASESTLYYLLASDFIRLILWAVLLAVPFSYFFYDKFFLFFLIKESSGMGFLEIFLSVIFLAVIGFVVIYWQTNRVAKMNPANNLRYE